MFTVESSTCAEGDTMTDTFIFTVPKFLDILFKNQSMRELQMEKPKGAAADSSGPDSRFQLKLRFLGRDNDTIEICYLSPIPLILKSELIIYYMFWVDQSCRERLLDRKENYTNQGNRWHHLGALLKRDIISNRDLYVTHENNSNMYDCLRLKINFTVHKNYDSCYSNVEKSKVAETEVIDDFGPLFTSGLYSDVTLKSVDGKEYKVHKNVLASRCDVLKAYFDHNTIECQTNTIESHFEAEVLEEVLTFIYSNKVKRVDDFPEKLLAAADFYQLSTLKSWCEEALSKKLATENVVEILELAELYSAENLIQSAVEFIAHGQTRQIIETERWAKLNSVESVKKVLKLYIMAYDNI